MSLSDWQEQTLEQMSESIDYGLTASAENNPTGCRFLRITDIVGASLNWENVPWVTVSETDQEKYKLNDDDIVIARTGATTGESLYIQNPQNAVFASYLVRYKIRSEHNARYVSYFLRSKSWWSYIRGVLGDKSAQPNASASTMAKVRLPVPPRKTQDVIAAILGTLDDKIELNRRMNATLEAMARALFKSWFVDFDPVRAKMEGKQPFGMNAETAALFPSCLVPSELSDIPEGWKVGKLSDIAEISSGQRPEDRNDTKTQRTPYPLYGGAGIMAYSTRFLLDRDIILTGRVGTLGKLIRVSGKFWPSDNTLLILPNTPEDRDYIYFSMAGMDLLSLNRGSTQPLLTQTDLKKQILLLPDGKTLRAYSHYSNELFKQKDALFAETEKLEKIRDYLLPKLISGDIRIPDAEKLVEGQL